jgi:dihydropteroate synthase
MDIELRTNPRRLPDPGSPWLASSLAGAAFPPDAVARLVESGGETYRLDGLTREEAELLERAAREAGAAAVVGGVRAPSARPPAEPPAAPGDDSQQTSTFRIRPHAAFSCALASTPRALPGLLAALHGAGAPDLGRLLALTRTRSAARAFDLPAPGGGLRIGPGACVMGIVNVTPDSFSDGGRFATAEDAIDHGRRLAEAGAAILDVGGESTRPGASPVPETEERRRVLPVVEALARRHGLVVSVDTSKARVAAEACAAGARMVNDVTALRGDPEMAAAVARAGVPVVLMHLRGVPATMQENPQYADVVGEVMAQLREAVARAVGAGIPEEAAVVDPGIGFGKALAHNVELLARLGEFRGLGRPVLAGVSRKRFLGDLTGRPVEGRAFGTAAAAAAAVLAGAAIVRVHDAGAMADVVAVANALARSG